MMQFYAQYNEYKQAVEHSLASVVAQPSPRGLYEPMQYVLAGGGKRIRPVLAMISCAAVGGNPYDALHGGLAVEMLHNFTLVHDDIMDDAGLRRNRPTVHAKWNDNTAILTGDGMMALAYSIVLKSGKYERLAEIIDALNHGIIEVCEGQMYDIEFQTSEDITLEDYEMMIEKKTAKMLELSVKIGALMSNCCPEIIDALRKYAIALGKAFQIHDDVLDITAESFEFGKTIGGDIVEGKKTYLIVRAMEQIQTMTETDQTLLREFQTGRGLPRERVPEMRSLFERNDILNDARTAIERFTTEAYTALEVLEDEHGKDMLLKFAQMLLAREH